MNDSNQNIQMTYTYFSKLVIKNCSWQQRKL